MTGDPSHKPRSHWYRVAAAFVVTAPLAALGVVVGGWPGILLVLVFAAVVVAIALEA